MKIIVVLAVAFAVTSADFFQGTPVNEARGARAYAAYNPFYTCQTSPPGTSYCYEGSTCSSSSRKFTCTDNYAYVTESCSGSTPYCTGDPGFAKCTAFPDRKCETGSNYPCQNVGYFPDLNDCYTFYNCYYDSYSQRIKPQEYKCNYGYPFNPNGPGDYKCQSGGECLTPNCLSNDAYEWSVLSYEPPTATQSPRSLNAMAVYCIGGRPKYAYECPIGMTFNGTNLCAESPSCIIQCTKDYQRAPDINNISKYYECRGGIANLVSCLSGRIYDPYTQNCVIAPPAPTTWTPTTVVDATTTTSLWTYDF